jgi:hypothetical protein
VVTGPSAASYNWHVSQESSEQKAQPSERDGAMSIGDDRLPEDLRPSDDNPLAQPADDDVPDDLLTQDGGSESSGGGSEDASPTGEGGAEAPLSQASSGASSNDDPDESAD